MSPLLGRPASKQYCSAETASRLLTCKPTLRGTEVSDLVAFPEALRIPSS